MTSYFTTPSVFFLVVMIIYLTIYFLHDICAPQVKILIIPLLSATNHGVSRNSANFKFEFKLFLQYGLRDICTPQVRFLIIPLLSPSKLIISCKRANFKSVFKTISLYYLRDIWVPQSKYSVFTDWFYIYISLYNLISFFHFHNV